MADSLPLLRQADHVTVLTIDSDADSRSNTSVEDVVAYLKAPGIDASGRVVHRQADAEEIIEFAHENAIELLVSGAYGHSRLREWIFGGVTRTLLSEQRFCRLVAS